MKLAIVAAIAIAAAPLARAQTVCEEVARINESALERFDNIKGPYLPGRSADEVSESDATLFGGYDCVIDQYFEAVHACTWAFETEADLLAAYAAKSAAIAPCFAGWNKDDLLVHDQSAPGQRTLAGVGYLDPPGAYELIVWAIIAEIDPAQDSGRYRLVIQTTDYN